MVNYIINDHFWRKNRSWDSKFTILKFSICHHCISLVNEASEWPDLVENSIFSKFWSNFDPLNIFLMFAGFFWPKYLQWRYQKSFDSHFQQLYSEIWPLKAVIFVKIDENRWFSLVLGGGSRRSHLPEGVDFSEFVCRMRFVTFHKYI